MSVLRWTVIAFACFATLVAVACNEAGAPSTGDAVSGEPTGSSGSPAPTTAVPVGPQFGTAGLIPRNYPNSNDADWIAMYEGSAEVGTLIGVYGDWRDADTDEGEIPTVFRAGYAAADRFGTFTPLIGLGFANEDILTGELTPTVDWTDVAEVARFTSVATSIVAEYEPGFIVIGGEINRIWEQHRASYDAFVSAWPAIYEAVKTAAPATEVGIGFQLEIMHGGGFLTGEQHEEHWHLLDGVRDHADFIAFSTYPYLDYETPEAIAADHYAAAATHAGIPVAFTEIGWPSRPLSNFPESGYGGSEDEQSAFATRFLGMTAGLDMRFALWSFQHDIGAVGGPAFESVSLRENDGTPKPAFEVWSAATD